MHTAIVPKARPGTTACRILFLCLFLLASGSAREAAGITLQAKYPDLAPGFLKAARLEPMDDELLLQAEGLQITRSELTDAFKDQEPKLRRQLEENLLFVLEQEAARRILLTEAQKAGISVAGANDQQAIQALFEHKTQEVQVSDDEARSFYQANQEMVNGAPFEQVQDDIRKYMLQDKKQQAVAIYMNGLSDASHLRINEKWAAEQVRRAADNPVDRARVSGRPTMVEFGATGCVPCDMMQPILDSLRKDYPEKLNVVFVHVGEEQILASRFGIRSIPVQVFFDARGKEVFRHVGFFAQAEVVKQVAQMGVSK